VTVQKTQQPFKVVGSQLVSGIGLHQKVHVGAGGLLLRVTLQRFEEGAGVGRVDDDQLAQPLRVLVGQAPGHSTAPVVGHQSGQWGRA
jgi:hypothetical protein